MIESVWFYLFTILCVFTIHKQYINVLCENPNYSVLKYAIYLLPNTYILMHFYSSAIRIKLLVVTCIQSNCDVNFILLSKQYKGSFKPTTKCRFSLLL